MGMDVYIKKYFWLIAPLVIVICAALAATAVGHMVEAVALTDSDKPARRPVVRAAPPPTPAADKPDAAKRPLATRNMFCSECVIEEPVAAEGPVTDDGTPPITSLPLKLVATSVAADEKSSFATVLNTTSNVEGAYGVGQEIPGAGPVVRVFGKFVDFENKSAKRVERISLLGMAEAPKPPPVAAEAPPDEEGKPKDDLLAAIDAGAEDVGLDGDVWEIVTGPTELQAVREALEGAGVEIESAELVQRPTTRTPVDEDRVRTLMRLIEALEAHDDVQAVHANFDVDAEVLERVAAA